LNNVYVSSNGYLICSAGGSARIGRKMPRGSVN
jgi:hypothetical protein